MCVCVCVCVCVCTVSRYYMKGHDADTRITMHERLEGQIVHSVSQTCIVLNVAFKLQRRQSHILLWSRKLSFGS